MVLVNSVVLVRGVLGLDQNALARTMFVFCTESMLAARGLPRSLSRTPDRPVMFGGAAIVTVALIGLAGEITTLGQTWPADCPEFIARAPESLPLDHPHLRGFRRHAHPIVVDDAHPRWAAQL